MKKLSSVPTRRRCSWRTSSQHSRQRAASSRLANRLWPVRRVRCRRPPPSASQIQHAVENLAGRLAREGRRQDLIGPRTRRASKPMNRVAVDTSCPCRPGPNHDVRKAQVGCSCRISFRRSSPLRPGGGPGKWRPRRRQSRAAVKWAARTARPGSPRIISRARSSAASNTFHPTRPAASRTTPALRQHDVTQLDPGPRPDCPTGSASA